MMSIPDMNSPQSALLRSRRGCGEASHEMENRKGRVRYLGSGYTSRTPAWTPGMTTPRDRVAAAYDANVAALQLVARKFNVPPADRRPLIHDVFVAFMRHSAGIVDDRAWLVAATCNACRNYWRDRKSGEPVAEAIVDPQQFAEEIAVRLDVASVLAAIPKRCRAVLRMRYVAGLSAEEIAARCAASSSAAYGRQIVHRCMRAAREALARIATRAV